jgi:hypothetical protein
MLVKFCVSAKRGDARAMLPALTTFFFCAAVPAVCWMAWCKYNFGDFTGSAGKIAILHWTLKPFNEWWCHPIFTPSGLWEFVSGLLATFWRGEMQWHSHPLILPVADCCYVILSIIMVAVALLAILPRFKMAEPPQRQALWFGFAGLAAAMVFFGFLSIIYDFHDCFHPSQAHPYFTSGRLMFGALIPFMLLFVYGLDRLLNRFGNAAKFAVLGALILFMLTTELITDWPVFFSQYNWYHL